MIRVKLTAFTTVILLCGCLSVCAQPYSNAVGLRAGWPYALTFKHYFDAQSALEIYGGIRPYSGGYRSSNISVAYQRHYDLGLSGDLAPLRWYWGAGASAFLWRYRNSFRGNRDDFASATIGLNGYLGLEYTFTQTPISLTFDWVPTISLGDIFDRSFGAESGGLGIRYVLGQ